MLDVRNIHVRYGAVDALRGVSLQVPKGKTVAVIGANGAGKTTLMRAISGLVPLAGGEIACEEQTMSKCRPSVIARRGISLVPEGRQIFSRLSVEENLRLGGFWLARASYPEALERVMAMFPRLRDRFHHLGGLLSGGEQQMLAIARALLAQPRLLLLDEPSMGLAPAIVDEIFETLRTLRESGVTVLLVEQSVQRALDAADYAYLLDLGRVAAEGRPIDLLRNTDLTQHYLGQEAPVDQEVVHA
ncbi:ABC transporter ATP-binding protein [Pandoraea anhela]|uniref:Leucine/isoleucine/valine transporter ATP-binding subunit n=1 Tax=Pandoraea anhela TaxID=2508295 RepID=A0A5E4WDD6_9BURK|nr:ABC transporter ATP-binding protein [Pandoraea anhela]VVE23097.1 leucine/isoleucine/valine transporter ATP-binding subunit [Pandoraea anhela]